mmetsp:Transcript_7840/g.17153  ORF Transcript_7840/g.17153 Transcript_7840/m.17153 type:complete len:91 (-) Transcript_7840:3046-3318(-)
MTKTYLRPFFWDDWALFPKSVCLSRDSQVFGSSDQGVGAKVLKTCITLFWVRVGMMLKVYGCRWLACVNSNLIVYTFVIPRPVLNTCITL